MGFALSFMQLTSSAFDNGGAIPAKFTGDAEDVSPAMAWSGAPEGTQSFALICHDPDAPLLLLAASARFGAGSRAGTHDVGVAGKDRTQRYRDESSCGHLLAFIALSVLQRAVPRQVGRNGLCFIADDRGTARPVKCVDNLAF